MKDIWVPMKMATALFLCVLAFMSRVQTAESRMPDTPQGGSPRTESKTLGAVVGSALKSVEVEYSDGIVRVWESSPRKLNDPQHRIAKLDVSHGMSLFLGERSGGGGWDVKRAVTWLLVLWIAHGLWCRRPGFRLCGAGRKRR